MPVIESKRLFLRRLTPADAEFIMVLMNTAGWLRYIGDRNIHSLQQADDYLNNGPIRSYRNGDFGLRLVALKTSGEAIGLCGLLQRDYLENPDIGFAFLPQYQGYGYASEMANEVLNYAFTSLGLQKVSAIILPTNQKSIKLVKQLGMQFEKTIPATANNAELYVYSVNRPRIFKQ